LRNDTSSVEEFFAAQCEFYRKFDNFSENFLEQFIDLHIKTISIGRRPVIELKKEGVSQGYGPW